MTKKLPTEFFTDPGPFPHAATAELRSKCPVHRIDVPPGASAYAVLDYEIIEEAFCDPSLSKQIENLPSAYREKIGSNSLLVLGNLGFSDPPKHNRLRKPLALAFKPKNVARLRNQIQRTVDELIDAFPVSKEFDLMSDFALPMPLNVICEYIGVPVEDKSLFQAWSHTLSQDPFQHDAQELKNASQEFSDYFIRLINQRRENSRDDLLTQLIKAKDEGSFSQEELLSTLLLLIIAGHKTVANMIGNGTYLLLRHPKQLQKLRQSPSLVHNAIEEILRFEGSAGWASLRIATEDIELGGVEVPKGSFVHLSLSSAGHDSKIYDNPDRFDIMRAPKRHLSFGHGPHFCLGASLARLQGDVAFTTLFRRLPELKLAISGEDVKWLADTSLSRGVEVLPLIASVKLPRG